MRRDRTAAVVAWLVGVFLCSRVLAAGPVPMRLDLYPRGGVAELMFLGRVMGVYQYGVEERWPYASAMAAWGGAMVLGDEGEWRGVGLSMELNGVGFGVEGEGRGWQRVGPEMERRVGQAGQGRYMAQLEHGVFWRLGEGVGREDESLLVEERRIRFMIEARRREVVMEWVSEFRVGGLESEVALGMGEGEGFRVQLVPGFSGVELKESGGRVWERGDGGGRSSGEGEWLVVKGEMEGRTLSLCFFGGVGKAGRLVWDAEGDRGLRLCLRPGEGGMPGRLVLGDRLTLKYWVVLRLGELTADEVQLIRAKAGD